jgi:acyl carrier protein
LNKLAGRDLTEESGPDQCADGGNSIGDSVLNTRATRQTSKSPSLKDRLEAAPPNQRRTLLIEQIRRETGRALGLSNLESLPNNRPLGELGLDSLMAVELRNALAETVGRSLPATLLFDYPTVEALTEYLSRRIPGLDESQSMPTKPLSAISTGLDALEQIENLDDDEIERLLKERETEKL